MGLEVLVGAGLLATMAGTGVQTMGAMGAANTNREMAALEMQVQQQNRKQMELEARRKQMEVIRTQQRAHSQALTAASSQGAQFSSSLQGAYGQISGQSTNNLLGINQNLDIGRNVADLNEQISGKRMDLAGWQSMSAFGGGLQGLGGAMMRGAPGFGRVTGGWNTGGGYNEDNTYGG